MSKNLSIVIITFNEEKNIERCLKSVQRIANEVIVVDSFSTDRTEEICKKHGATFIRNKFEGHIEQKNFALTQATHDIVLSLDADEEVTPKLEDSIKEKLANWTKDGYALNRLPNYCGHWIRHCGWHPDWGLRLFDRTKGSWTGVNPHDKYVIPSGNTGKLNGVLHHYTFHTINQHISQINLFTDISSKAAFEKGKRSSVFHILFKPKFKFFRDFILKGGFRDGYYGYVICKNSAHAKFLKYAKLRALHANKRNEGITS